jgi:superfamily II DNA or RNA helicase
LQILAHLVEESTIDTAIITTDGTDLLDQWSTQLFIAASNLTPKYRVLRHYGPHHERDEYLLEPNGSILIASRPQVHHALRRLQPKIRERTLLIHDEVHRLGSASNIRDLAGLSDEIPYRLGLSATPEREYDEEGTDFIERHIGPPVFEFKLEDAIRRGILCGFDYHPLAYDLTDEDRKALHDVHAIKAARQHAGIPMSPEELYMAIARVYKRSPAKLPVFQTFLRDHPEILDRCIVFVEDRDYGNEVLHLIHRYRHDFHTYYAEDEKHHLQDFARGEIACLVTCHRLSEGIDIRNLRNVVLFSSARSRLETIQRMGRCLRVDPQNPTKQAVVVDFIRAQDEGVEQLNADQQRQAWLSALAKIKPEE